MPFAFDLTGRVRKVRKRRIMIEQQLSEVTNPICAQRHVLVLARYLDRDKEEIMVKIRYNLRPESFDIDDIEGARERANNKHLCEIDTLQEVNEIGHGPKYIDHVIQTAGEMFPCPDTDVYFILMNRVDGENVADIYEDLSFDQLESIREQLARILEHMRTKGRILYSQNPDYLRFDRVHNKLYMIDFNFISPITAEEIPSEITPNSLFVLGYNLWSEEHLEKVTKIKTKKKDTKAVRGRAAEGDSVGPSEQKASARYSLRPRPRGL